jgi:predicted nucleic acid-binding protein
MSYEGLIPAPIDRNTVETAMTYTHSLLFSDALHTATRISNNINTIATNDNDFERIKELTIWKP